MKYLKAGDVIKVGDEYQDPHNGKWYRSSCVGKKVGIKGTTQLKYRRHAK